MPFCWYPRDACRITSPISSQHCFQLMDNFPWISSTYHQFSIICSIISLWWVAHPEARWVAPWGVGPFHRNAEFSKVARDWNHARNSMDKIHINWYQSLLILVWSWFIVGGHFVVERCWNIFEDSYKICMLMWVWHHGGVHPDHPKSSWTGVRKVHPGHSQGQWALVDRFRSHQDN